MRPTACPTVAPPRLSRRKASREGNAHIKPTAATCAAMRTPQRTAGERRRLSPASRARIVRSHASKAGKPRPVAAVRASSASLVMRTGPCTPETAGRAGAGASRTDRRPPVAAVTTNHKTRRRVVLPAFCCVSCVCRAWPAFRRPRCARWPVSSRGRGEEVVLAIGRRAACRT